MNFDKIVSRKTIGILLLVIAILGSATVYESPRMRQARSHWFLPAP